MASCRSLSRAAPLLLKANPAPLTTRPFTTTVFRHEEFPQRTPLGEFYESLLRQKSPYAFSSKPEEPPNSADPSVLPADKEPVADESKGTAPTAGGKKKPGRKPKSESGEQPNSASESPSTFQASSSPPTSPPELQPSNPTSSSQSPPVPSPPPATAQEKARIIFGSRLLPPAEHGDRSALKEKESRLIAGVLVPPRPEEPDNCCMSGCVNCVWELYREELEEWTAKKAEAREALRAQERESRTAPAMADGAESMSMDDDGGGSEINWDGKITKDLWEDDDVLAGIPVGMREFMKQEKRLKEKHARAGTSPS